MSRVNIDAKAFGDPRFRKLARRLELPGGRFEALGRMAYLWWVATETGNQTFEREDIALAIGNDLDRTDDEIVAALVQSNLAELDSGRVRIKGATGRIEWLSRRRKAAVRGGKASGKSRKKKANQRRTDGSNQTGTSGMNQNEPGVEPSGSGSGSGSGSSCLAKAKHSSAGVEVKSATAAVILAFNRSLKRNLSAPPWEAAVKRVLAKGYTEAQIRGVIWWAAGEGAPWSDDEERRKKLSPQTLLKLQSPQGYRTFPQYLSCAGELWREEHRGQEPPWESGDAE